MLIESHVNSLFNSVSYRVGNVLIDPGDDWTFEGLDCVLLTHAHFDHIYGLKRLLQQNPHARVFTNEAGKLMLADAKRNLSRYYDSNFVFEFPEAVSLVSDGEVVALDSGLSAKAVFTPGHNPSCITWVIGEALFTGDAYIPGLKTVTNLPKGNKADTAASEALILSLACSRTIYPGHKI